jgi:hypothetical protein
MEDKCSTRRDTRFGFHDRAVRKMICDFRFICALATGLAVFPMLSNAANKTTFLHTQGQDIVNAEGQKILLRGVGLGNWMLPEGYMWKFGNEGDRPRRIEKIINDLIGPENSKQFWTEFRNNYIAEPDIARIAQLGFNSVRPSLNSRLFLTETDPPAYNPEGFQLLDNLVAWCKANDIYLIIDMHAAPGGQTGQNIDDSANDQPLLFMEKKYQDRLVDLWKKIASRYSNEPTVAGYDLLNEPLPERTGAEKKYKAQLEPLYKRITKAIREVDSKHIIIVEGADWANDWSVFTKPFDKNMIYQFHYYCWDNPNTLKSIRQYLDYRERFNAPVWVGETGERDNAIYWATTEYFEANNIGWSFWPWKKMDTRNTPYSIKPPANWDAVAAYSRGGDKPSKEVAQKALNELLVNIRLANCEFFPDVVNAILRQAPGRIEAENFGHAGQNKSYFVEDTNQHAKFYRVSEPVAIGMSGRNSRRSAQYISLNANEWTAYTISSEMAKEYGVTAGVKVGAPAKIELKIGDQIRDVTISPGDWTEIKLGDFSLAKGANRVQWGVKSGSVDLDWIDLGPTEKSRQSASVVSSDSSK